MHRLRQAAAVFLLACTALALWHARHWPLVNDAALMRYVVFLMHRGMAPYRETGDINFPGAYAIPWLSGVLAQVLHVSEAAMARVTDALALLLAGLAMQRLLETKSGTDRWFGAIWAGSLFALFHLRDGIGQANQRDLWMAVLLLWAVALVRDPKRAALVGALIGAAVTIKPLAAAWLLFLFWTPRRKIALLGFFAPLAAGVLFLAHWHSFGDFRRVLAVDLPYHARLADGSLPQLLARSSAPSILLLLLLASACLLLLTRPQARTWLPPRSPEASLLLLATLLGLVCFLAQGKGYPYQRYPYLAFFFPLAALAFRRASASSGRLARGLGLAGFVCGLCCAPAYLRAAARAAWPTEAAAAMESALRGQPDGEVQCIDAVSGCTDALLALGLRQATGTLYDEYLFPQTPAAWGTAYPGFPPGAALPRAVLLARARFRPALEAHPPRMLIVFSWLFPEGPGDYRKLALWPWFQQYLAAHYTLNAEHSFARAENGPLGFRVYIRQ